jgi:hypothetical protein
VPKWTPADETGILMQDSRGYILSISGGGHWRLELLCRIRPDQLGTRVRVQGIRTDFNTISVDSLGSA